MVLNESIAILLFSSISVFIAGMIFLLVIKLFKLRTEVAIPVSFFPIGILAALFWLTQATFVIECREHDVVKHIAFGSADFTAADGQKLHLERNGKKNVFLVNTTSRTLVLVDVLYGAARADYKKYDELIDPHTCFVAEAKPDYYPVENPPNSIEASGGDENLTRKWLRFAIEEEEY